jgi:hypothetical protein
VRRVGVRFGGAESDQEFRRRFEAIRQELQQLGWTEARNLRIDIRWGGDASPTTPTACAERQRNCSPSNRTLSFLEVGVRLSGPCNRPPGACRLCLLA